MDLLIAWLIYPGLLTALLLGLGYARIIGAALPSPRQLAAGLGSREGAAAAVGVILAGISLAALPWPGHPAAGSANWLWAWAGFELAFLLPLVPALLGGAPKLVRAAIRELQIGITARALLWAALASALSLAADWRAIALPAHVLALLAAVVCFPAAVGFGPFADEQTVTPQGTALGLSDSAAACERGGRVMRAGILLAALAVAVLPSTSNSIWIGLLVIGAGWLTYGLALRRIAGRLPRMPVPTALQLGWIVAVPLTVMAAIALVFVR